MKFNQLTAIKEVDKGVSSNGKKYRRFLWSCDCGKEKIIRLYSVKSGLTKSCGCLQVKTVKNIMTKHGMSFSRIERIHHAMKQRCYNKNNKDYYNYGGRGIKVCDNWHKFESFYDDVKNIYKDGLTIERIDVDKDYCKDNVSFIEHKKQARNKKNSLKFMHKGEKKCLAEICEIEEKEYIKIWKMVRKKGMSIYDALNT